MRLTALLPPLLTDPAIDALVTAAGSRSRTDRSVVVAPGARPAVLAAMALGETGVCGADNSLRIARAALHFWEEPPISGECGSGAVFFSHCPLRCCFCLSA